MILQRGRWNCLTLLKIYCWSTFLFAPTNIRSSTLWRAFIHHDIRQVFEIFIFIVWNFFLKFVLSGFVSPLFYHQRIYDTSLGSRDIAIQIFRCASISCSGYECGGANFFVRYFDSDFWIYTNRSSDLQTLFFTT